MRISLAVQAYISVAMCRPVPALTKRKVLSLFLNIEWVSASQT